jgi:hypothetical protein
MGTSRLNDLFPRASQRAFPPFLNMGGHPANRGKAGLLWNGIRGVPRFVHCDIAANLCGHTKLRLAPDRHRAWNIAEFDLGRIRDVSSARGYQQR